MLLFSSFTGEIKSCFAFHFALIKPSQNSDYLFVYLFCLFISLSDLKYFCTRLIMLLIKMLFFNIHTYIYIV